MDNGSKHDAETTQDYLKAKITLSGQVSLISLIPTEHSMKTENKTDCRETHKQPGTAGSSNKT